MFEEFDSDSILENMLDDVDDRYDKREGSPIWDAAAPAAVQMGELYGNLDMVLDEVFADSASYYYLIKRAAERGIFPRQETQALCRMVVAPPETPISIGDRFNLGDLNYMVTSIEEEKGTYQLTCEEPGSMANQQTGELIPIDTKNDLNEMEEAVLTEILIPGEDDEDVEDFRERYFSSFQDESFGGNRADYIARVGEIDGVGGVKVYRCWNGGYHPSQLIPEAGVTEWFENQSGETLGEPVYAWLKRVYDAASEKKLTVGGTVQIEITNAEYKSPSQTLIRLVQETLDPEQSAGEGDGTAPIGHVVRVSGVKERPISITLQGIEYKSGYTFDNRKEEVESAIDRYFFQLRQEWAQEDRLVIRISQIEHHLMEIEGILDIGQTLLNEKAENVILQSDEIPVRGEVNG
mgnify:CR=1 FL=1